jgi:hypothetical protein
MPDAQSEPLVAGALLSGVSLPSCPSGVMTNLRSGRGPRAFVTIHSAACPECRRYIYADFASVADRIAEWGGRLAVVVPGRVERASELAKTPVDGMEFLADPDGKLATGKAMVVITDEWGEVYFVADAGERHDLPTALDIGDWIQFLAIQCPECEGPEGEWRTMKKA